MVAVAGLGPGVPRVPRVGQARWDASPMSEICNEAVPYPPDGQAREWWQRLRKAFGTASSAELRARARPR